MTEPARTREDFMQLLMGSEDPAEELHEALAACALFAKAECEMEPGDFGSAAAKAWAAMERELEDEEG